MDEIRISHVEKSYTTLSTDLVIGGAKRPSRTRKVLQDVNLTFPAGKLSVLVGRSGCGKSTLLKLLAGKEAPDAGEITLPEGWHTALLSPSRMSSPGPTCGRMWRWRPASAERPRSAMSTRWSM